MIKIDVKHSLRRNYIDASGKETRELVNLVCFCMLNGAGLLSADDPIESVEDYYTRLGHAGCRACPLVEKCSACMMCE